jgi:multiple sugar transport system permease protein
VNSVWISTATTVLGIIVAVPPLRLFTIQFPWSSAIILFSPATNMFPAVVFLIPLFIMMRWLDLVTRTPR